MRATPKLLGILFAIAFSAPPCLAQEAPRWQAEFDNFDKQDAQDPPPKDAILFLGSSSIRFWKTSDAFPDLKTINRGFGGSFVSDSVENFDRLATRYHPKTIVFYAGDNDIGSGKTADQVFDDYKALVALVKKDLPETRLIYISIKPSILRWNLIEEVRKANALIKEFSEHEDNVTFLDVDAPMLGDDGKPRPSLFIKDGLHLNDEGYALWNKLLRPLLDSPPTNRRAFNFKL